MAIVNMNKFTLLALETQKKALLEKIQRFEQVQLINSKSIKDDKKFNFLNSDNEASNSQMVIEKLTKVNFIISLLSNFKTSKREKGNFFGTRKEIKYDELIERAKDYNWQEVYEVLKQKDEEISSLNNTINNLKSDIENLIPWKELDASLEELKNLKFCSSILGTIPAQCKDMLIQKLESVGKYYFEELGQNKNDLYVMLIVLNENSSNVENVLKESNFTKINLNYSGIPRNLIDTYNNKIEELNVKISEINDSIKGYLSELDKFKLMNDYYNIEFDKIKACENFVKSEKVIVIQGWIPSEEKEKLEKLINEICKQNYYIRFNEPNEDDNIPIMLKNNKFVEPFESVTEMYSMPSYHEIDPTPIMSIFYVFFFGMMLGDAGYGLVLTVSTAVILKKCKLEKNIKDFMKLFFFLGISTTLWGVIFGGYFGDAPAKFLGIKQQLGLFDTSKDIMKIFMMSLVFGLIHIYTGLGIKAYMLIKNKKYADVLFDVVTWYMSITGLILWLSGYSSSVGKILTIAGLVGLVLTQGRSAKSIGGKIAGGLYGTYGITSYLGDIISYSRLLALGLATGFIASAFNLMIVLIPKPLVYIIGPIFFIATHLFNIGINSLGAYVHTSRLQYLEFFGKFYEGGGKKFSPFKMNSKYVKVTDNEHN